MCFMQYRLNEVSFRCHSEPELKFATYISKLWIRTIQISDVKGDDRC